MGIKRNILILSWEGGVERIGKNQRNRGIKIVRKKEEKKNSLIYILSYFSMLGRGGGGGERKGGKQFLER